MTSTGLTEGEPAHRLQARGRLPRRRSSRSYASILRANTFTVPNGILLVFGVLTITFASWRDALFLGILAANIAIGSVQEIRSKRELDRLAALVAPERWRHGSCRGSYCGCARAQRRRSTSAVRLGSIRCGGSKWWRSSNTSRVKSGKMSRARSASRP